MVVEVAAAAVVVTTGKLTFLVGQYLFPFLEMGFSKKEKVLFSVQKRKLSIELLCNK